MIVNIINSKADLVILQGNLTKFRYLISSLSRVSLYTKGSRLLNIQDNLEVSLTTRDRLLQYPNLVLETLVGEDRYYVEHVSTSVILGLWGERLEKIPLQAYLSGWDLSGVTIENNQEKDPFLLEYCLSRLRSKDISPRAFIHTDSTDKKLGEYIQEFKGQGLQERGGLTYEVFDLGEN